MLPGHFFTGKPLQVGGLPGTCNLTLPVACVARAKAQGGGALIFALNGR